MPSPTITIKPPPRRIYIHGDALADDPEAYFCSFWDVFVSADHFEKTFSLEQHRERFRVGLRDYLRAVKHGENIIRPHGFSAVQDPWATYWKMIDELPGDRRSYPRSRRVP